MMANNKTFNTLVTILVKGKEDIKDYHFMVQWFKIIGTKSYDFEAEDDLDAFEKWTKISDLFRCFGYPIKRFSPTKCRDRFYQWSAFYAKNYDTLNGKLEPKLQEIFDLLKIVHILDSTKVWSRSNRTLSLITKISQQKEIKEYLIALESSDVFEKEKKKIGQDTIIRLFQTFNIDSDDNGGGDDPPSFTAFGNMNLSDDLLRGIHDLNYKEPSTIQQEAIVPCIEGRDVIAQAQSGTGKTAAFAIAILQRINISLNECQALILASTHELVEQIHKEVSQLGKYLNVKCHSSIGGTYTEEEVQTLQQGFHVIVGTPGRVIDMIEREAIRTEHIKIFVLDECDQLLDLCGKFCSRKRTRGFQHQIFVVFRALKPTIQVFLSSATMPPQVLEMSRTFMRSPLRLLVKDQDLTLRGLSQFYVLTNQDNQKFGVFLDLYQTIIKSEAFESSKIQIFVYCNTRSTVDFIAENLENFGIEVAYSHGQMDQKHRKWTLNDFRKGYSRVLITTDLLGRGIDVKEVEFVINYDLPVDRETYMHRVGRSGRFGRTGKAISLVIDRQLEKLQELQNFYHTEIKPLPDDLSSII